MDFRRFDLLYRKRTFLSPPALCATSPLSKRGGMKRCALPPLTIRGGIGGWLRDISPYHNVLLWFPSAKGAVSQRLTEGLYGVLYHFFAEKMVRVTCGKIKRRDNRGERRGGRFFGQTMKKGFFGREKNSRPEISFEKRKVAGTGRIYKCRTKRRAPKRRKGRGRGGRG